MTYLDDLRENKIGASFLVFNKKPEHRIYQSYELHVIKAFTYTLNDIFDLENSKNKRISPGAQTHSSISFWFLAIESYINSLIKLVCVKNQIPFSIYKNQDLGKRVISLIELLEIEKKEFNQFDTIGKLNEFCQFRNELFHDRNFGDKINFKKTFFSETPFFCNQVDTFQSILILLEIVQLLRYAISGLDTIPNAIVKNQEFAAWEKIDILYKEILLPSLLSSLKKHSLEIKNPLDPPNFSSLSSQLFEKGEVSCLLTVEQNAGLFIETNDLNTAFCNTYYFDFLKRYNYKPDTFIIPKTMIN